MIGEIVLACILAWICVTLGIALRRGLRSLNGTTTQSRQEPPRGAFPVLPPRDAGSKPVLGPPRITQSIRRFRVEGVDAMNTGDVAYMVDAASAENAKLKAELAGVIVTKVTEEPGQPAANSPR